MPDDKGPSVDADGCLIDPPVPEAKQRKRFANMMGLLDAMCGEDREVGLMAQYRAAAVNDARRAQWVETLRGARQVITKTIAVLENRRP